MAEERNIRTEMLTDIRGWGGGLIFMGILHFVLSSFLLAEWGIVLIVIGILCLLIKHRAMFILLGMSLIFIGLLNGLGSLESGTGFWTIFGGLQVYWGIKEIVKFKTYGEKTVLNQNQSEVLTDKSDRQHQSVEFTNP